LSYAYRSHVFEDGARASLKAAADNGCHCPFWLPTKGQECLHLCSYRDLSVDYSPKEWFDSISIASGYEDVAVGVVQAEREFTSEMREKCKTVALIEGKYELAVAGTSELVVQLGNHLETKAVIVIDLSVNDCMNSLLVIVKRLIARRAQVIDLQTNMTQCYGAALVSYLTAVLFYFSFHQYDRWD